MYKSGWYIVAFLAITVGLYPALYLLVDMSEGFLKSKSSDVLENRAWQAAFYTHILGGGIALLTGWSQFNERWRTLKRRLHRSLGKVYVTAVLISGIAGGYLAVFATGGFIASLGFGLLALCWITTTALAFRSIRFGKVVSHQKWMIRSYVLTFAAVTLRLWMPVLIGLLHMEFIPAYLVVSWLCWVPNVVVGEILVRFRKTNRESLGTVAS